MPKNDMPKNGLTAGSLKTNRDFLAMLAKNPLSRDLLSVHGRSELLANPYAAALMKYVASCALDPCDEIEMPKEWQNNKTTTWQDKATLADLYNNSHGVFRGELGLCGASYAKWAKENNVESAGDIENKLWRSEAPDSECLERVSACLLARVNAIGSSVVFSMRGDGLSLQPKVRVQTSFREDHGTPIQSFQRCDACQGVDQLRRNCDWEPRFVGQCTAGSEVRLTLTHPKDKARIRVCGGIYGCDDPDPAAGPTTKKTDGTLFPLPPHYSLGTLKLRAQDQATVNFACPSNEPDGTGYYSVMLGVGRDGQALTSGSDVQRIGAPGSPSNADAYPASEEAVFSVPEGSFYGTLFKDSRDLDSTEKQSPDRKPDENQSPDRKPDERQSPDRKPDENQSPDRKTDEKQCQCQCPKPAEKRSLDLEPDEKQSPDQMLAGHQYACYSNGWGKGEAMLAHRLCAVPGAGCFVNQPGPCESKFDGRRSTSRGRCESARTAISSLGIADICSGKAKTEWGNPYTSYLNHPCDLFGSKQACEDVLGSTANPHIKKRPLKSTPAVMDTLK